MQDSLRKRFPTRQVLPSDYHAQKRLAQGHLRSYFSRRRYRNVTAALREVYDLRNGFTYSPQA